MSDLWAGALIGQQSLEQDGWSFEIDHDNGDPDYVRVLCKRHRQSYGYVRCYATGAAWATQARVERLGDSPGLVPGVFSSATQLVKYLEERLDLEARHGEGIRLSGRSF